MNRVVIPPFRRSGEEKNAKKEKDRDKIRLSLEKTRKLSVAVVYHRIDGDGLCSQAVIAHALKDNPNIGRLDVIGYNHGDRLPVLSGYDKVFVADIALPGEVMLALYREKRLVWIDHHSTSIDEGVRLGYGRAPGLRRVGVGACELCWEHLYGRPAPLLVQLLSAYDVYDKERFDWESMTLPFQYGIRTRLGLSADAFSALFEASLDNGMNDNLVAWLLNDGRCILRYVRQVGWRSAGAYGFDVTVAGRYRALCVMTTEFGAVPLEGAAVKGGYDLIINVNRMDAETYKVSCFAAQGDAPLHIGEYMRDHYHGGGHRNAAGGELTYRQFEKLIREGVI